MMTLEREPGPSPRGRGNQRTQWEVTALAGSIPAWAGKPQGTGSPWHTRQVHPRVGGETVYDLRRMTDTLGPSPRGRGNRDDYDRVRRRAGSIPAWAGKPAENFFQRYEGKVHPRVGGETENPALGGSSSPYGVRGVHPRVGGETRLPSSDHGGFKRSGRGPSPRGRGNRAVEAGTAVLVRGSIPAWAGKPRRRTAQGSRAQVHPRVGGETAICASSSSSSCGPSPRGRGNRRKRDARAISQGLSPRGRGNPRCRAHGARCCGSIPAWAGKPEHTHSTQAHTQVHPRVGGETHRSADPSQLSRGPSPRGRGNLGTRIDITSDAGSIPAWAGKPPAQPGRYPRSEVHPRVGGETVQNVALGALFGGPSPRGRGNPVQVVEVEPRTGSIPAWAGKPARPRPRARTFTGSIPAWAGKPQRTIERRVPAAGPSPRGRGNPGSLSDVSSNTGSIPAWAGKPRGVGCRIHSAHGQGPSPRGRGNPINAVKGKSRAGPSPRGRGNRRQSWLHRDARWTECWVHPRVGGETISPSRGGKAVHRVGGKPWRPSLKAWTTVHPRVGGETIAVVSERRLRSQRVHPRVGGETPRSQVLIRDPRSIPAWAGKPRTTQVRPCYMREGPSPRGRGNPGTGPRETACDDGPSPRGRGNRPAASTSDAALIRVHPRVGGETRPSPPRGRGP